MNFLKGRGILAATWKIGEKFYRCTERNGNTEFVGQEMKLDAVLSQCVHVSGNIRYRGVW
jgi:hypothetical protein